MSLWVYKQFYGVLFLFFSSSSWFVISPILYWFLESPIFCLAINCLLTAMSGLNIGENRAEGGGRFGWGSCHWLPPQNCLRPGIKELRERRGGKTWRILSVLCELLGVSFPIPQAWFPLSSLFCPIVLTSSQNILEGEKWSTLHQFSGTLNSLHFPSLPVAVHFSVFPNSCAAHSIQVL